MDAGPSGGAGLVDAGESRGAELVDVGAKGWQSRGVMSVLYESRGGAKSVHVKVVELTQTIQNSFVHLIIVEQRPPRTTHLPALAQMSLRVVPHTDPQKPAPMRRKSDVVILCNVYFVSSV